MKYTIFFILLLNINCTKTEDRGSISSPIKKNVFNQTDSGFYMAYYNRIDTTFIDSLYYFKSMYDTLFATSQYIYNLKAIEQEVQLSTTSDSLIIKLINPHYDYIGIVVNVDEDSAIWGSMYPDSIMSIALDDTIGFSNGCVINYGIHPLGDTIGSIGLHLERQLYNRKRQPTSR